MRLRHLPVLLICLWTTWAQAQESLGVIPPHTLRMSVDPYVAFVEDPGGHLTFEQLLREDTVPWQPSGGKAFNQGYSASTWWLRLQLQSQLPESSKRLLEISYAVLDHVDMAVVYANARVERYQLGDKQPFRMRPVEHPYFIVPLTMTPGEQVTVYVRLRSSSSIQAPMVLWEDQEFFNFNNTRIMIHGLYFGTMVVIALYNLLIFFGLGERVYLYYVGYVVSMGTFMASLGGHAFQYLWPTLTQWNDQAIIVSLAGVVTFGLIFTRRFLSLSNYSRTLDHIARGGAIMGAAMMASAFILSYKFNIVTLIPLATASCILGLVMGGYTWKKGEPAAKYFCIAWASMLSGGIMLALSKFNMLPANTFTEHGIQIGSALEVVLLSFALAERINVERRLRYEAQSAALETQKKVNEILEQRVQQRTEELEHLNRRLQELSDTDQLTGLHNRRYLDGMIQLEWGRSQRYGHHLSVLLLDVDHFKQVNDQHGHLTGDRCLKVLADCIKGCLRHTSDHATRYGGEEFCAVLPETDLSGAWVVAERIRTKVAATPITDDGLVLKVTVSIGVACAAPDNNLKRVDLLIEKADEALYRSKSNGRNRVNAAPLCTRDEPMQVASLERFRCIKGCDG